MYRSRRGLAALSAAVAVLLAFASPASAQTTQPDPRPVCTVHIGTAYASHWGGDSALATCSESESLTSAFSVAWRAFAPRQAVHTCTILSSADVPYAYTAGHAIAIYDNALVESSEDDAVTLCALALARGELVLDADENPYAP